MRTTEGMCGSYESRDSFPCTMEEETGKEVNLLRAGQPYNILLHSYRGSSFCQKSLATSTLFGRDRSDSCLGGCAFSLIISSCFAGPRRMRSVMRNNGPPCLGRPIMWLMGWSLAGKKVKRA